MKALTPTTQPSVEKDPTHLTISDVPPLRTFLVRLWNAETATFQTVMTQAHATDTVDGILTFLTYTVRGGHPFGWARRIFKEWLDMEEVVVTEDTRKLVH